MTQHSYKDLLPSDRWENRLTPTKGPLDDIQARAEAARCLYCYDPPCAQACPAGIDVGRFMWDLSSGNLRGAARAILSRNVFGVTCARVCPTPAQCEGACVLTHAGLPPVPVGQLQRYATEWAYRSDSSLFKRKPSTGKKVALIGAGPASLACAHALTVEGHDCTVFEKRDLPGGLGTYALAPHKLSSADVLAEVDRIAEVGFEIRCGVELGRDLVLAELLKQFDALFLGVGLGQDTTLAMRRGPATLPGVVGALELVEAVKTRPADEVSLLRGVTDAVVVGGGSTAMDAAHQLRELGVERVTVLYRRDEQHMPCYPHEREATRRTGAVLSLLTTPVEYLADAQGRLRGVHVAPCSLGGADESGRRAVTVEEGPEQLVPAQLAVLAIGQQRPRQMGLDQGELSFDGRGCIEVVDDEGQTEDPRIFAGGDCVTGGEELVHAVAAGRRAAERIHRFLAGEEAQ
jgi:glutamate synthase (NADPH/NADH) small chain